MSGWELLVIISGDVFILVEWIIFRKLLFSVIME